LSAAAIYEFSMIETSNAYQDPASLAQEISDAWIAMKLKDRDAASQPETL
jgi:hypothetical protein